METKREENQRGHKTLPRVDLFRLCYMKMHEVFQLLITLRVNHKRRRKITQGTFQWIFRKLDCVCDLDGETNIKILCG